MPTLQFITGSGSGSTVAQGVVGQIAALNQTIANLNNVYFQYYSTGATTNNSVSFYLNGKLTTISNVDPTLTLVDYLRYQTPFKGVKAHCRQGGCGVCAVMISYYDQDTASFRNVSINSCLKLVVQCDGLAIWTTEGIKQSAGSYHPVQERIAKTYGVQCGACTTAQVMTQYTALQTGTFMQKAKLEFLEKNFDGNLCRCSCYPGIIAMARSFLPTGPGCPEVWSGSTLLGWDLNATGPGNANQNDDGGFYANLGFMSTGYINVANSPYIYNQLNPKGFKTYDPSFDKHATSNSTIASYLQNFTPSAGTYTNTLKSVTYSRVTSLNSLYSQIQIAGASNCKIVAAGTSYGVPNYSRPNTNLFLDVNYISELHSTRVTSTGAVFGANVPINKAVMLMYTGASNDTKFNDIADHLFYISGNHVRNTASICGGLVMAKNGGFASDVAPLLIAANATLNCTYVYPGYTIDANGISIQDYLNLSTADGKFIVIRSIVIPAKATGEVFWSYRVAQRYFNSHAWLNCAASYTVTANVISNARIAYGGLVGGVGVARASLTEAYLNGKDISAGATSAGTGALNTIISGAVTQVQSDLATIVTPIAAFQGVDAEGTGDGKVAFRKNLGTTLFYMSFLNLLKNQGYLNNYSSVKSSLETWISGAADSTRQPEIMYQWLSQTQRQDYPAHFSLPRYDAILIASGEVKYVDDQPPHQDALWMASALTTIPVGSIDWNSPTTIASLATARATPGVEMVLTAQDWYQAVKQSVEFKFMTSFGATGSTNFTSYTGSNQNSGFTSSFELLADMYIQHVGQRVALVLSKDMEIARKTAKAMTFGYKNIYSNYATSITDALNKEIALNGSIANKTGTYVLATLPVEAVATSLGRNNINNLREGRIRAGYARPNFPYTGGFGTPLELMDSSITVDANGNNLYPRSATKYTFTGAYDGVAYDSYYYTGTQGQLIPWSDYIIQSTGALTGEKYHMAFETQTVNVFRDEQGMFIINAAHQQPATPLGGGNLWLPFGLDKFNTIVKVRRIAGGFGQKLAGGASSPLLLALFACWTAGGRQIRYVQELDEDMATNGAESQQYMPFKVGFNATGTIKSLHYQSYATSHYAPVRDWVGAAVKLGNDEYRGNSGDIFTNLEDISRQFVGTYLTQIPASYYYQNIVKVPRPVRTPYRGPYYGNMNYSWGTIMDEIAAFLDVPFTDIAYLNAPSMKKVWNKNTTPQDLDPYVWKSMMDRLETKYDYTGKKASIDAFNAANKYVKRGIAVYYGKYDCLNRIPAQTSSIIKIFPGGYVSVWLGSSMECGQGVTAKAVQYISSRLKCPPGYIKIMDGVDFALHHGTPLSAGTQGTQVVLRSLENACDQFLKYCSQWNLLTGCYGEPALGQDGDVILQNVYTGAFNPIYGNNITNPDVYLLNVGAKYNMSSAMTGNNGLGFGAGWTRLIGNIDQCFNVSITGTDTNSFSWPASQPGAGQTVANDNQLIFQGISNTAFMLSNIGRPSTFGLTGSTANIQVPIAAMSVVEVNMLSGNIRILEADLLADCGDSINPQLDQGQIYGGYIFGLGSAFKEERTFDTNGNMLIKDTWDYKPPCIVDIPELFNVDFFGNTGAFNDQNQRQVMDAKFVNEGSVQAVHSTFFAVKEAIRSFRKQQLGNTVVARRFNLRQPATPDRIQAAAGFTPAMLNVNPL